MSKALLGFTIFLFVIATGCTTPGMRRAGVNAQAPGRSPQMLAVYMPWFGDHTHADVGYSSQDPAVLRKQVQQARGMGITAFVVDWYGERLRYSDHNFGLLQEAASENKFHVALLYNEAEDEDSRATDGAIAAFDKAYKDYIGPQARYRDAYLTHNGHPMIFVFPKHGDVDWNRVRDHYSNWEATPLLFYKDEPPQQFADVFAGAYAWVQPGREGWSADGSNWGERYLDHFYRTMKNKYPDKIAIGGEESAGLSIRHHVPEKDGILAGLLCCEMVARRGKTLQQQLIELFGKVGSYFPRRENFRLTPQVKQKFTEKLQAEPQEFFGHKVTQVVRTDGLKLVLDDGSWVCYRLSGTEPVVRVYAEARSADGLQKLIAAAEQWVFE